MKKFGQFCPLAQAAQLLCERWTLLVVRELIAGSTRFNDLQRGVPLMSPTLLSARLKQLTSAGVVERTGEKGKYSYQLTKAGEELAPIVKSLGAWGHRWVQTSLVVEDLDASKGATHWWLVAENGEVELCLNEPGGDVDIVVRGPLARMTAVWTCQKHFTDAVADGDLKVFGDEKLVASLPDWLQASGLSLLGVQSMEAQS